MVDLFHVFGFSISSMDVIILHLVLSSLHNMLILLCVMLCDMSLIPVSIYIYIYIYIYIVYIYVCVLSFSFYRHRTK